MLSIAIAPHRRALWFSLVSRVLVGLFTFLGTPLSLAPSEPQPSLSWNAHRAGGVRGCAAHGPAEAPARYGHGYPRCAPGQRTSWLMRDTAATQPSEPGLDSADFPDPLERVPAGVSCPALVRAFVLCPRVAGAGLLHFTAVQSRAPPLIA
jgi:hypothetical protein